MKTYWKCQVFVHFHSVGKEKWWQCHLLDYLKFHIKLWNKPWDHPKICFIIAKWEQWIRMRKVSAFPSCNLQNVIRKVIFNNKKENTIDVNGLNGHSVNAFLYQIHSLLYQWLSIKRPEVIDLKTMRVVSCYWNVLLWTELQIAKILDLWAPKADNSAKVRLQEFKELHNGSIIGSDGYSSPVQLGHNISREFRLKKK